MNQNLFLFALLLTIGLQTQSCISDDDLLILNDEPLRGTWTAVSYEGIEEYSTFSVGQVATFNNTVEAFDLDYEITFEEDTYRTAGSYSLAIATFTVNNSPAGTDTLWQNEVAIVADYLATDSMLVSDSTFYAITGIPHELSESTIEQTIDYELNASATELTIHRSWEYLREFASGGFSRIIVSSSSVWEKL